MPIPSWALLLSYWLHMLITVVWLGGLAALALLVLPAMRRNLKPGEFAAWLAGLNRRLDPLGWFSLGLLTFTGLLQMDANPNYVGLFGVSNLWAAAIFAKHVVFLGMIAISGYLTWVVSPALSRAALRRAKGSSIKADLPILARFQALITLNLVLGFLVLAFTALARIS
ncbi:MAG: CopD family protein [Anaerolineales bacterium]